MRKTIITFFAFFFPVIVSAQVFNQNQVIVLPYTGVVYSTSTSGGIKLSATTSPTVGYITATTTNATSTLQNLYVAGREGIGTRNPSYNLQIQGTSGAPDAVGAPGLLLLGGSLGDQEASIKMGYVTGAYSWIQGLPWPLYINPLATYSSLNNVILNNVGGKVGINYSAPESKLHIKTQEQIGQGTVVDLFNDGTSILGTETAFTQQLSVGDWMCGDTSGNCGIVTDIISDISLSVDREVDWSAENFHFFSSLFKLTAHDGSTSMFVNPLGAVNFSTSAIVPNTVDSNFRFENPTGAQVTRYEGQDYSKQEWSANHIGGNAAESGKWQIYARNDGGNTPMLHAGLLNDAENFESTAFSIFRNGTLLTTYQLGGNVGVGTDNSQARIHVAGEARAGIGTVTDTFNDGSQIDGVDTIFFSQLHVGDYMCGDSTSSCATITSISDDNVLSVNAEVDWFEETFTYYSNPFRVDKYDGSKGIYENPLGYLTMDGNVAVGDVNGFDFFTLFQNNPNVRFAGRTGTNEIFMIRPCSVYGVSGSGAPCITFQSSNDAVNASIAYEFEGTTLNFGSANAFGGFGGVTIGTNRVQAQLSVAAPNATSTDILAVGNTVTNGSTGFTLQTSRFIVKNDGRNGVSSSSPWGMLSVSATSSRSTLPVFVVSTSTASATSTTFIVLPNGNVGIATTSPWRTLSVQGNMALSNPTAFATGDSAVCWRAGGEITVDAGVSSCIVSTRKAKHDIQTSNSASAEQRISQLKAVVFKYNGSNKEDIGLIAEEVAAIDPRYAQYDPKTGDPKAINWSAITTDLVSVVQLQEKKDRTNSGTDLLLGALGGGASSFLIRRKKKDLEVKS